MHLAKPLVIPVLVANLTAKFPLFLGEDWNKCNLNLFSLRIINSYENNDWYNLQYNCKKQNLVKRFMKH